MPRDGERHPDHCAPGRDLTVIPAELLCRRTPPPGSVGLRRHRLLSFRLDVSLVPRKLSDVPEHLFPPLLAGSLSPAKAPGLVALNLELPQPFHTCSLGVSSRCTRLGRTSEGDLPFPVSWAGSLVEGGSAARVQCQAVALRPDTAADPAHCRAWGISGQRSRSFHRASIGRPRSRWHGLRGGHRALDPRPETMGSRPGAFVVPPTSSSWPPGLHGSQDSKGG